MDAIRINKYLSDCGYCSRREADRLLEGGRITIDGKQAIIGMKVVAGQIVCVDGVQVKKEEEEILIAFHKPKGIVCTTSKKDKNNIVDYINYGKRIYPIGRLDKDSEGLILLTNQGELVDKILRGSNYHEKEYIVHVDKKITNEMIETMKKGIYLNELEKTTRPCSITVLDATCFKIILTQGLNRQIRRMCETVGYQVVSLKRIRIMNIELGRLKAGTYRKVTPMEKKILLLNL